MGNAFHLAVDQQVENFLKIFCIRMSNPHLIEFMPDNHFGVFV